MIRSRRIPQVLDRICDGRTVLASALVTLNGELLGTSTEAEALRPDPEAFGTLVADLVVEYLRLGEAQAALAGAASPSNNNSSSNNNNKGHKSPLQCLLMELEEGVVAASQCGDFLVLAVGAPDAPPGLVKAKVETTAVYVQEALSTLTEG